MFGSPDALSAMSRVFGAKAVCAENLSRKQPERTRLIVGGIEWEHRRIHQRLESSNYRPLSFSTGECRFLPARGRVAVINNKDFENWDNTDVALRESFDGNDLRELRATLEALGYFVVYHRFDEAVPEARFFIDDAEIFRDGRCVDMRDIYQLEDDANLRTARQLELYSRADLAICPQGGNSYLPIMNRVPTLVLTKSPRLVEYQDLSRIYGVRVEVLTSVRALVELLRGGELSVELDWLRP